MGKEKRKERRIDQNIGIFVHVHACKDHPELVGLSVPGDATDFSPHGLRYTSKLLLPPGTLINITIGIGKPFSVFLLLGEVRWEFEIDGHLTMGVNLIEGEYSDMERWAETFDTIFVEDSSLK